MDHLKAVLLLGALGVLLAWQVFGQFQAGEATRSASPDLQAYQHTTGINPADAGVPDERSESLALGAFRGAEEGAGPTIADPAQPTPHGKPARLSLLEALISQVLKFFLNL